MQCLCAEVSTKQNTQHMAETDRQADAAIYNEGYETFAQMEQMDATF